ncbi:phospholipase A2 inhibitor NAI-like [Leptodactylus fuscus]|uniref:phospholipase A2 inhibitor NAI-like n=1 Tax=Leptodactylus fuscus TaxID=238119 RepID=UPI003F4ED3B8
MPSPLAVLCLVAVSLEGAFSLSCYHCNTVGTDCNTNEKVCDKSFDICISTITDISTPGKTSTKSVVRSCGNKEQCNTTYSISMNSTNLHAVVKCCDKDRCQISNLEVQKSTTENNVECLTCNEASDKCKSPIKIKCIGDQKKCVSYGAKDAKSQVKFTSQVCATENVCTMKNVTTLPFDQILATKFECANHAPSLIPGLLFPVAVVIAMLKLLS